MVTTRIRLARNLAGIPFPHRASAADCAQVAARVRRSLRQSETRVWSSFRLRDMSETDLARLLHERWLSFSSFGKADEIWLLIEERPCGATVVINEEDHVRIQAVTPGWDPASPWEAVHAAEASLGRDVRFAHDESRWGFLTASAGNVGTGLRVSAMLHLAGLGLIGERNGVLSAARSLDIAIRGIHGEGSDPAGDLFQISNAVSFGRPESGLRDRVESVVEHLAASEMRARARLRADPDILLRRLESARQMAGQDHLTAQQCWSVLSVLRLSGECGVSKRVASTVFADGVRSLGGGGRQDDARRAARLRSLLSGCL